MFKYPTKLNNSINLIRNVPIWRTHQTRCQHSSLRSSRDGTDQASFQNEIKRRQLQAKRSIFVESSNDENSIKELTNYCSRIGDIQNLFRTDIDSKSYLLVEFNNTSSPTEIIHSAFHVGNYLTDGKVQTKGRFLYFNPKNEPLTKRNQFGYRREANMVDRETFLSAMRKEDTIDDQIRTMYNLNKLTDLSSRLRFFTALQVEEAISGVFHEAQVLPFGSSINGFGQMESDLDINLISCGNTTRKSPFSSIELGQPDVAVRHNFKNNLYVVSGIAKHWLQGVTDVTRVFNARVPIIKYVQTLTQLECDASMGNYSGFQMSEIFYTFGELDERVRPFVSYIRGWAKEFDIIRPFPTLGISNFMLTCLTIFFLQQLPEPIIPPSDAFVTRHTSNENVPYITDISKLNWESANSSTLAELMLQFFEYYGKFDFDNNAISLTTATIKGNITQDAIYVYNPLEQDLNICRNVCEFERDQFIAMCQVSLKALTNDKIDAVRLLQLYDHQKLDEFVNSIVKPEVNSSRNSNQRRLDVQNLMKTL